MRGARPARHLRNNSFREGLGILLGARRGMRAASPQFLASGAKNNFRLTFNHAKSYPSAREISARIDHSGRMLKMAAWPRPTSGMRFLLHEPAHAPECFFVAIPICGNFKSLHHNREDKLRRDILDLAAQAKLGGGSRGSCICGAAFQRRRVMRRSLCGKRSSARA